MASETNHLYGDLWSADANQRHSRRLRVGLGKRDSFEASDRSPEKEVTSLQREAKVQWTEIPSAQESRTYRRS